MATGNWDPINTPGNRALNPFLERAAPSGCWSRRASWHGSKHSSVKAWSERLGGRHTSGIQLRRCDGMNFYKRHVSIVGARVPPLFDTPLFSGVSGGEGGGCHLRKSGPA